MKKHFRLLFVLLFFVSTLQGMQILSWFYQKDPEQVKLYKKKCTMLKKNLAFCSWAPILGGPKNELEYSGYELPSAERFTKSDIPHTPFRFLQYIYYKEYYDNQRKDMSQNFSLKMLAQDPNTSLLQACKEARIDGYSAVGIALLDAPDESWYAKEFIIMRKKALVQELLNLSFVPTAKDQELAYLELYARTPELTRLAMVLLAERIKNPESDLAKLPMELLLKIIPAEKPLIPRELCRDCPKIRKLY